MKKIMTKEKIVGIMILFAIILSFGKVYAKSNGNIVLNDIEYTEEYKQYLQLSKEEKEKKLVPNQYKVVNSKSNTEYLKELTNTFKMSKLLRNTLSNKYTLQTVIPENIAIKNQMETNSCWAFATIGALETNLALQDKINSKTAKTYDFSERHMAYGIVRNSFLNNAKNPYGLNRTVSNGGNFVMATMYLSNGMGAINETDLPFANNEDNIDIAQIQNKKVVTTLKDTLIFSAPTTATEKQELMNKMKQHISNYGGIYASIHGAGIVNDCYNNQTGAIYCTSHDIDHAVVIIGWDDNYSKDNFKTGNKPSANGAWIIKNSWGTQVSAYLADIKKQIYDNNTAACNANGWNSANSIPDNFIISQLESTYGTGKVKIENNVIRIELGDKGYMYVSYEDKNIYQGLAGVEKVVPNKDYYNIYQNDELGFSKAIATPNSHVYLANVFTRDASIKEAVDRISIVTLQEFDCKVYINANGSSKAKSDLKQVKLKTGDSIKLKPGYRTIEFAEPVELKGNQFAIVVETTTDQESSIVTIENKGIEGWENATINPGESFVSGEGYFEDNIWDDFAGKEAGYSGNVCIKAFTIQDIPKVLESIVITKVPNKIAYEEEENFDKTGMIVTARYSNGEEKEITNYTIVDGNNLSKDKTTVTVRYTEEGVTKETTQAITVKEKELVIIPEKVLESIIITKAPNKIEYEEEENFDKTGMIVKARYSDGEEVEITNYTIVDGSSLPKGKTTITIRYTEKGVTKETIQAITVKEKEEVVVPQKVLDSIFVSQVPAKTTYEEEQNFDKTGMKVMARYNNGEEAEITNYTIVDGNGLTKGKTSVTIRYSEEGITKETTQAITVTEKTVVVEPEKKRLESITISVAPARTTYEEGQNFDKTGMKVIARYSNGEEIEITNYTIIDGNNLNKNRTTITVRYTEEGITKETTQSIIVKEKELVIEPEKKVLEGIFINQVPVKTQYEEGENFDKTGMKVIARYNNGDEEEITNYTIIDGNNLSKDKTEITIRYTEEGITKTVVQEIQVKEKTAVKPDEPDLPVEREPISCDYTEAKAIATDKEAYFYTNQENEAYVKMKIKISNIKIGNEETSYTHYYYLSDKQGEKDIKDSEWKKVEVTKENGIFTITIDINTKEIKNIEEMSETDNLFIYIKEVAEIDGKSKIVIPEISLESTSEVSIYLNDKKVNSLDVITKNEDNNSNEKDNTIAPGVIPQAGAFPIILASMIVAATIGGFAYYKSKNIDK